MMMQKSEELLLSIIIPVYNVEKYLRKCLDSIYRDNTLPYEQYEVLVVNDGSPDDSQCIIDEYAQQYPNLQALIKDNGGLSSARNYALDRARGRYIYFVDSDDSIIASNLVKALHFAMDKNLDLLALKYVRVDEDGHFLEKQDRAYYHSVQVKPISGAELLNRCTIMSAVWSYLYKREVIERHQLRFPLGLIHEDEGFTPIFISYVERFMYAPLLVYHYLIREGSIMNTDTQERKMRSYRDMKEIVSQLSRVADDLADEYCAKGLRKKMNQLVAGLLTRLRNMPSSYIDKDKEVADLYQRGFLPLSLHNVRPKITLGALLLRIRPVLNLFLRR